MIIEYIWKLEPWVLAIYTCSMILLIVYTLGYLHLMWKSRTLEKNQDETVPSIPDEPPFVTIQLPVYNEQYVVERLLNAAGAMDYPRDRFEIQLLDDSTDETTLLAGRCLRRLARHGVQVAHIRRKNRTGFKAGALAHGMQSARGEFIAIFDADFIPKPDFLRKTVGYFQDPKTAVVQTRWAYLNEKASLVTRIEAFCLNLHFGFEQPRRARTGLFLNFNGTCGIWRAAAIINAGGWMARTLSEDIDLSYRAQLRGWNIHYLNDYETPGELPEEMSGFRAQQYRWMKGGAENAALYLKSLFSSPVPPSVRWHGAHHLLASSVYLVVLSALFLSTPLAILKNRVIQFDYIHFSLPFLLSTAALCWVFYAAQRPRGLRGNLRFVGMMILFLVFTMGLCVHNGLAVLSGWLGRKSAFIRTPKNGDKPWMLNVYVRRGIDPEIWRELLMLAYLATGLYLGWKRGQFGFFPIQVMACAGLLWIALLSFIHPFRAWIGRYAVQMADSSKGVIT